jgi:DHA2 family multidrug resistance protein
MSDAPAAAPQRKPVNKWLVALSVSFGSLMATIDSSIVNVALPHIRGSVGATLTEITAISTGYIIATVLVMPLTGFLGAFFGQKRVYMASLLLFCIGSALCGTATSLPLLVIYRVIQGFGAGSLQPTQQAILRQTFPPEEQGMAMAMFAMVIMVGPALGPPLGGWITDQYSWPWIFYVNLPVGVVGLFMVWRFVHEPDDVKRENAERASKMRANMDWTGLVLMAIAIGTMQYVFEEGPSHDWLDSWLICGALFICISAAIAFVVNELTVPAPAVNLRLFADRTYASGTIIGAVMFAMLMGSMFLLPVFLQELLHYDATDSGIALMPRTIVMAMAMPIVGRLYNKLPPAVMVAFGVFMFVIGSYQLSHISLDTSTTDIIVPLGITGVGFAFLFVPLTTAALSNIKRHQLADASGLNSFVRQIGGSIGLTIFTSLLTNYTAQAKTSVSTSISMLRPEAMAQYGATVQQMLARGMDWVTANGVAQMMYGGKAALQATVLAFEKSFMLQGISFLAVLPILFFLRVERSPTPQKVHVEAVE